MKLLMLIRLRFGLWQARRGKQQIARIKRRNADLLALLAQAQLMTNRPFQPGRSTKQCPACGDPRMVPLHSTNTKICPSCGTEIPWALTGDQKPTHQPHRAPRKRNKE